MAIPVIILAGGFGKRLKHVIEDVPKPMAPVRESPFLELLLDYLVEQGIQHVILATGYKAKHIQDYFGNNYRTLKIDYSHEKKPLGTGGAIQQALELFNLEEAFVMNGDTFFEVNLYHLIRFYHQFNADVILSVKYLKSFHRYGSVSWNEQNQIISFDEKKPLDEGWINGGIYLLKRGLFQSITCKNFSFETEILEQTVALNTKIFALPSASYFVDIGIPKDYFSFISRKLNPIQKKSSKVSTLFLDRDGVINKRLPGEYVKKTEEFEFLPGVMAALMILRPKFDHLVIVTNQQGVGKGLMSQIELNHVHDFMKLSLSQHGVTIDEIYYCSALASESPLDRKPNIGMAMKAKRQFKDIDWNDCVLVGDSLSDIEFGLRMGMSTVLVGQKSNTKIADLQFDDLLAFAHSLDE